MRILITGGTGLLGKALIDTAGRGCEIVATYLENCKLDDSHGVKYRKLDICDEMGCDEIFRAARPEVVIHTAGVGSPDHAEKHKDLSREINVGGTRNIRNRCNRYGAKMIYISSNGIYNGKSAPYGEDDEARPINYYGKLKLEGEKVTRKAKVPYAIVRPILMYGWNHPSGRKNIATFALSQLKNGDRVYAYDDVFITPLYSESCAKAIWKIIEEEKYDTFNLGGEDRLSIYGLVCKVAEVFGFSPELVVPVQQGFFNELVKRPRDTSFYTQKMRAVLGIAPISVEKGLCHMKKTGNL